ncbi:hypothetical protein JCM10212_006678 [Sporobolomyces blumeae]
MAGGLFAVYRDPTLPAPGQASSQRSTGSTNMRRKDGFAVFRATTGASANAGHKENIDPFSLGGGKKVSGLGKGKKAAMGAKSLEAGSCSAASTKSSVLSSRPTRIPKTASLSQPSTNGICTGTLRTRVLPDLPPLEPETDAVKASSASGRPPHRPAGLDLTRSQLPTLGNSSERCLDSPASNVDSGYAASGKASDTELEAGLEDGGANFDDESDMSLDVDGSEITTHEANRRARALTESPLAEVTQAFTGLGNFSNAPASPSPTQVALNRVVPPPRSRTSPSKSVSSLPPRLRPYSTTATTKKVKPGQTAPAQPKAAPTSMRV